MIELHSITIHLIDSNSMLIVHCIYNLIQSIVNSCDKKKTTPDCISQWLGLWFVRMCSGGMIGYPHRITIHLAGRKAVSQEFPDQQLEFLLEKEDRQGSIMEH